MSNSELKTRDMTTEIARLDTIAEASQLTQLDATGKFSRAFTLAEAMGQLDAAITDGMMDAILPLMNSPLGFLTDRDPAQHTKKNGQPVDPYPASIVKRCMIEAVLRGVQMVGNEINIISARPYITKAGFSRLVREYPGLSDLRLNFGVPRVRDGGALILCSASWKIEGADRSYPERDIPIKSNQYMGVDAIIGKATRKLLAAVYEQLVGSEHTIPEGDVSDTIDVPASPSVLVDNGGDDALMKDWTPTVKDAADRPADEGEPAEDTKPTLYSESVDLFAGEHDIDPAAADARLREFCARMYSTVPEAMTDSQMADLARNVKGGKVRP